MTYRLATCYLKTGNVKEAAIWFETLRSTSRRYHADCTYYVAYIRCTQRRHDEALKGFLSLQDDAKYKNLVPYYIAEIYLLKKQYDKAEIVAQNALSAHSGGTPSAQPNTISGSITKPPAPSSSIWNLIPNPPPAGGTPSTCWACPAINAAYIRKSPQPWEK